MSRTVKTVMTWMTCCNTHGDAIAAQGICNFLYMFVWVSGAHFMKQITRVPTDDNNTNWLRHLTICGQGACILESYHRRKLYSKCALNWIGCFGSHWFALVSFALVALVALVCIGWGTWPESALVGPRTRPGHWFHWIRYFSWNIYKNRSCWRAWHEAIR